jgi:hypothetical protein
LSGTQRWQVIFFGHSIKIVTSKNWRLEDYREDREKQTLEPRTEEKDEEAPYGKFGSILANLASLNTTNL